MTTQRLRDMKGLGPKSEASLQEVGIRTPAELRAMGAVQAFIRLRRDGRVKPSLNFLYALAGAIEGDHWVNIARSERTRLLTELEGYRELEQMLRKEGIEVER